MKNIYLKSGLIVQKLAEKMLFYEVDQRIPKIGDLTDEFQVGRGTIQSALKTLEESGCMKTESRGHLGTFLRNKNDNELLKYAGIERITAVMPLPYSRKYEGLATGLTYEFERIPLALNLAFMRGSEPRIEGVREGRYDFAIVSGFAAHEEKKHHKENDIEVGLSFGERTYVSNHSVIFAERDKKEICDGMRIGVDSNSTDQRTLTLTESEGKNVEYIELNYMHLLENIKAKNIDATIWNVDELDSNDYHLMPLTSPKAIRYEKDMNEAVCVVKKGNRTMEYILKMISKQRIVDVQVQVENGNYIPRY